MISKKQYIFKMGVVSKVKESIEKHEMIKAGDLVILGLSGGPDSLCLFDVLVKLRAEMGFGLRAVHVNHKFRPGAAEEDQCFVEGLCLKEEIPCDTFVIDCNKMAKDEGLSSEEAGRKARYDSFFDVANRQVQEGVPAEHIKIAVAQNRNDQAETMLFRIIRGSGLEGLTGIKPARKTREGYGVIRPLLEVDRKAIEEYCDVEELNPRIDHTNAEQIYTRNKIRLGLIPYINENYGGDIEESLLRLRENLLEDSEYLNSVVENTFSEICIESRQEHGEKNVILSRERLSELPQALRHRVVAKALALAGLDRDYGRVHILAIDELLESGSASGSLDLPGGCTVKTAYDKVYFIVEGSGREDERRIGKQLGSLEISVMEASSFHAKPGIAAFDADLMAMDLGAKGVESLKEKIELRTRREGDFIKLKAGTKSIQDLFVDMKVPRHERDSVKMACAGSLVLWIPEGIIRARYAEKYSVSKGTKRVLLLEIQR